MSRFLRMFRFDNQELPPSVLREFDAGDASTFAKALKFGGQSVSSNLAATFRSHPTPDASQFEIEASQQLKDLYVADFELARLKDMKEATLLRLYLRLERHLPHAMMAIAGTVLKMISFVGAWSPWMRFCKTCFIDSALQVWGNPFMWLTDPLNFAILVAFVPMLSILLFTCQVALMSLEYITIAQNYMAAISHEDGGGLSMCSWDDPGMFNRGLLKVNAAKKAMGAPRDGAGTASFHNDMPKFDIDIAFALLYMSAIIYERDTNLIGFATNLYDAVIVKTIRDGQPIPSSPFLHSDKELASLRYTIEKCLFGANRRVIEQAKEWEMNFMAVSDLNGRTGPCGGLFWSEKSSAPFIVAVFKGTTPTNYSEYIVDATFQKTDARAYLHGAAHQGFFNSLFPTYSRLGLRSSPHGFMCAAIRAKVAEITAKINLAPEYNGRIPLYVAGHSLGGALASLFYYRLRKGRDLDDVCDVRDTYVYGCPGLGDSDFAMGYASDTCIPYNSTPTLWRVINDLDMVARVPFTPSTLFNGGVGDENHLLISKGVIKHQTMMDYSLIGTGIRISRDELRSPKGYSADGVDQDPVDSPEYSTILRRASKTFVGHIIGRMVSWLQRFSHGNRAQRISLLVPFMVRDHFCSEYNASLEICEAYFRETTEAKFRAAKLFNLPDLMGQRLTGGPLSNVPAAAEGAIHDITAPLKSIPILGGLLDNTERVAEANVGMNEVDFRPEAVEVSDGEVSPAAPMEATLKGTDQAGDMVEQAGSV